MPKAKMIGKQCKEVLTAEALFTDREEPRKAFWDVYSSMETGDYEVIAYYGVGGIGKTTLLHKLEKEINDKIEDGKQDHLFISFEDKPEKETVLYLISRSLMRYHKKLTCPRFDAAFLRYLELSGKSVEPYEKKIKKLIPEDSVAAAIINIADNITPLPISKVLGYAEEAYSFSQKASREIKNKQLEDFLSHINSLTAGELRNTLQVYLRMDIEDTLLEREKPFVIFLDGYENFVDVRETGVEFSRLEDDQWLKDPDEDGFCPIPNVLWVLAGREQPHWDSEVLPPEHMHRIGDLSEADTKLFFEKVGITDPDLVDGLYKLTNGTPAYLDMCVTTYRNVSEKRTPVLRDFGKNTDYLAARYMKNMNNDMRQLIYILVGLPNVWERDFAETVIKKIGYAHCIHSFDEILSMSIVEQVNGGYRLNKTLRDVVIVEDKISQENRREQTIPELASICAAETIIKNLKDSKETDARMEALHQLVDLLENATSFMIDADDVKSVVAVIEKETELTVSYSTCERILSAIIAYLYTENYTADLRIYCQNKRNQIFPKMGLYKQAKAYAADTYAEAIKTLPENSADRAESLQVLANSETYVGNYKESLRLTRECYEARVEILGKEHVDTLKSLNNLSSVHYMLGDYEMAAKLMEECFEARKRLFGTEHPFTLMTMSNLAVQYSILGDHEKALQLKEDCYQARAKILGKEHPTTLQSLLSLAKEYSDLGDYEKAEASAKECYEILCDVLGKNHPDTIKALNCYANRVEERGNHETAAALLEECEACIIRAMGKDHPMNCEVLMDLAHVYAALGDREKALAYGQECGELAIRKLGPDHPRTKKYLSEVEKLKA